MSTATAVKTYRDRTGHTYDCVSRAHQILRLSGAFLAHAMTGPQIESAAVDALNTGDVECHCGPEDVIEYSDPCDACGAKAGEECLPGCIGKAAHEDSTEPVILLTDQEPAAVTLPTVTCTYGGHECCAERTAYRVTRIDATGIVTYEVCAEHRAECTATASRYVHGWGDVTLTVARVTA